VEFNDCVTLHLSLVSSKCSILAASSVHSPPLPRHQKPAPHTAVLPCCRYMRAAHHAAAVLYERRSPLGLVGSSFHVGANTWSHLGSTIGPGSDSYYEYLLKVHMRGRGSGGVHLQQQACAGVRSSGCTCCKRRILCALLHLSVSIMQTALAITSKACTFLVPQGGHTSLFPLCSAVLPLQAYLMFGDRQYLDMFIELYAATMKHMKVGVGAWHYGHGGVYCIATAQPGPQAVMLQPCVGWERCAHTLHTCIAYVYC
jgi:hypothetical protein